MFILNLKELSCDYLSNKLEIALRFYTRANDKFQYVESAKSTLSLWPNDAGIIHGLGLVLVKAI